VRFQNGVQVEQLEDQKFQGKVTARYSFKDGQVVDQEQVTDGEPPRSSAPFGRVEEELRNMAG
jgi:leucyl-tRNA synthetase